MCAVKKLKSILIKPAGPDCNLNCSYCFYLDKQHFFSKRTSHRMSLDVLEKIIKQVMEQGESPISFIWQGGEPTLMGWEFFQKAVEFQAKYSRGQLVENSLQTNGILIDPRWADFLLENRFLVGLSLDGPEHIHNRYRKTGSQKDTWEKVINTARMLRDRGVAVNAVCVVTDYSSRFPAEIYRFFKSERFGYLQFIPMLNAGNSNTDQEDPAQLSAEKFGQFLCGLFESWTADFENGYPRSYIRFFDAVLHLYLKLPPSECTLLPNCGEYLVVEHNGQVYSCDFYVSPDWNLGNIMENPLIEMLNSGRQQDFGLRKSRLPGECLQCNWLQYCRGGCPAYRDMQSGTLNYCESYRRFFEKADPVMTELAQKWKHDQKIRTRKKEVQQALIKGELHPQRNAPCPCGSGKKYKKCCM
ncbi:MAG: anaerobic sulfatase maturase, partial [Calditrichia bacterium]